MHDGYRPRFLSREGLILPGEKRVIVIAAPAATVDWQITVPGGRQWRLCAGYTQLNTDATAGNRSVGLRVASTEGVIADYSSNANVVAGVTAAIGYGHSATTFAEWNNELATPVPIPDFWLLPGMILEAATAFVGAADVYGATRLFIEECFYDDQQLSQHHYEREHAAALAHTSQPAPSGGH